MPSRWLRKGPDKLKKCSERRTDSCSTETDGCCSLISCNYCLTWEGYDGTDYGTANFPEGGTAWTGTVGGAEFIAYWEKDEYGECQFVVNFDGVEIYRKSCYEGQSCRDSSDSADATIDYESGTLTWTKFEPRPLPAVEDPETRCRTHFCADCHCTCQCLCVTVTDADGTVTRGEICDVSYSDCDAPEWSGTVGGIAISLTLDRDQETGGCILGGSIGSQEVDWTPVSGCQSLSASFTLDDYTVVSVTCKECGCAADDAGVCICGRSLGAAPTLSFASANAPGTIHTITLTYSDNIDDGLVCTPVMPCQGYIGRFDGILALPMGGSRTEGIDFRLVCSLDCSGYCLYWRYDSRFIEGWCRNVSPGSVDCTCPATIVYPAGNTSSVFDCTVDPWSYQIPEWLIEEDPTNCE